MSQELALTNTGDPTSRGAFADWAGMVASIGCAIHCAAMPLVIAYLPALGLSWLADEGFHQYMAVACLVLAIAAFIPGWRKHGSLAPVAWGAAGLVLLNTAAFGFAGSCCPRCDETVATAVAADACDESTCGSEGCSECVVEETPSTESQAALAGIPLPLVTPLGGLLLVVGHVVNHRKRCRCQGDGCCLETHIVGLDVDGKFAEN